MLPMAAWRALCVVALALLAGPSVKESLAQPLLEIAPSLGRQMDGGVIVVFVGTGIDDPAQWEDGGCVEVAVEPDDYNDEIETLYTSQVVCPTPSRPTIAVLTPPTASGTLVVSWNGTEARQPFRVPGHAVAMASAHIGQTAVLSPTHVPGDGVLRDTRPDATVWGGAAQAVAYVACLVVLALRLRLRWAVPPLFVSMVLIVPFGAEAGPHVPAWIVGLTWLLLVVEAVWRHRERKGRGETDREGQATDEACDAP